MNVQKSVFYNGINYVDIDGNISLPSDFETDRIPNKGDVLCFRSVIGNDYTYHHCIVLYIYQANEGWGKPINEMEIMTKCIYVVTKKIEPELGEKTWTSISEILNKSLRKEKIKTVLESESE